MMKLFKILLCASLAVGLFQPVISAEAQPLINEFMASNTSTIMDEDGDYPDWIEIYNPGATSVDLTGYGLSDDPTDPYKWVFPNYILKSGEYLLVFASDKNRTLVPGHWETVIQLGDIWRYFIGDSEPPENWRSVGFDDSGWLSGPGGFGSKYNAGGTSIPKAISLYIRKTFDIDDVANITHCLLQIDYQDAFVAYINGHEISRSNIGQIGIPPSYDEEPKEYMRSRMFYGNNPDVFEIDKIQSVLSPGKNVLAIQVHNKRKTYSDIMVIPFLTSGMSIPPLNPRGVPDILKFSIPYLHTNFKISSSGETLQLTDNSGSICDLVETGAIPSNMSRGRQPDVGSEFVFFTEPTPGESNNTEAFTGYADTVLVSLPGGFYDNNVTLELSVNSPNSEIRYTLDGSDPSDNSSVYSAPISIGGWLPQSTIVVRARAFETGLLPGRISTHTYFINENITLPVISLSTNPENLWDDDIGIYVKGNSNTLCGYPVQPTGIGNYCEDWERPIHIEFYEPDGSLGFSIDAGAKILGKTTKVVPQKSLAIFARPEYGYSEINHQIFPDLPISEFKSIVLRNGGSEQIATRSTFFRGGLHLTLNSTLDLEVQAYRPAVVFLNGVYWGIHNIREKMNEDYLASHHGVDPDRVDILDDYHARFDVSDILQEYQTGATTWTCFVIEGNTDHYHALLRYMLDNDEADSTVYEYLKTQIDIENFIDYMVSRIFTSDPDGLGHNCKFWRPQTPTGRWRWLMYDTEWGFGLTEDPFGIPGPAYLSNLLYFYSKPIQLSKAPEANFMMYSLLENINFRNDFANRYADYLNTIYSTEHVIPQIMALKSAIESEVPRHLARWSKELNQYTRNAIDSIDDWYENLETLYEFAEKRPYYARLNLVNEFNLSGTADVTLDVSQSVAGKIKINTLAIEEYPWTGIYFQDVPIKLTVLPNPGYRFTGWTGVEQTDAVSITVTLTEDTSLTAHFEEDTTAINTIVINEINYNSSNTFNPEDWVELYNAYDIPVDISAWVFKDEDDAHTFVIPENTVIAAGDYLVLCRDDTLFHAAFPEVDNYAGSFNFGLSGQGELIRFYDSNGALIDWLNYDDADPWSVEPDGNGPTLALMNPIRDNSLPEYWSASGEHGTPGEKNDVYSGVDEDEETDVPVAFSLGQNYPNPFNSVTTIPFSVSQSGRVTIEIYSILGQRVDKILDDNMTSGYHHVVFKSENFPSGLYLYSIKTGNFYKTKQMLLLK